MLNSLQKEEFSALENFCRQDNFGVRILCEYAAAPGDPSLLTGWNKEPGANPRCAFSLKGEKAVVCGELTDEDCQCLALLGCREVFSPPQPGNTVLQQRESGAVGSLSELSFSAQHETEPITAETLRDIFPLLREDLPETDRTTFGNWYVSLSHRLRHGLCRIQAVRRQGEIVSLAMTAAEWHTGGVIGFVRTQEQFRGNGFGSAVVSALGGSLRQEGKQAWICARDSLFPFYEAIGYTKINTWWYSQL